MLVRVGHLHPFNADVIHISPEIDLLQVDVSVKIRFIDARILKVHCIRPLLVRLAP